MATTLERVTQPLETQGLQAMFEARKRVFVDLLKWDLPVLDGRFELDQFDDEHAIYILVAGQDGRHLASARLLKTVRPHLLDTLFPTLCAGAIPSAGDTLEITRFCLDPDPTARERRRARDRLVTALVQYALAHGVRTYTGVAQMSWLQQILAFGWRCRPLGLPAVAGGATIGALRIDIDEETPALLSQNGIWTPERGAADTALAA